MSLAAIESLLRRSIGLRAESIGHDAVRAAIRRRLEVIHPPAGQDPGQLGSPAELDRYLERLLQDPVELQALVEEVSVPETFFFRDVAPFEVLAEHARTDWMKPGGRPLRLLSAPCSTGEEAYSIAITLLEVGLPASRFHVDGIDIRQAGLRTAEAAVYGQYSVRGGAAATCRYLEKLGDTQLQVAAEARRPVRFRQANLLEPMFLSDQTAYDVVFCRNLLIYFDEAARQQALVQLRRLVRPGGLLFVGSAETLIVSGKGFRLTGRSGAFSLRRDDDAETTRPGHLGAIRTTLPPPSSTPLRPSSPPKASPPPATLRPSAPPPGGMPQRPSSPPPSAVPAAPAAPFPPVPGAGLPPRTFSRRPSSVKRFSLDLLNEAQRLADAGEVDQAYTLCEKLVESTPSADAFFLLGVLSRATQKGSPADYFSRAIYLDPAHIDALSHLALEKDRAGDPEAAGRLRERARRAQQRKAEAK